MWKKLGEMGAFIIDATSVVWSVLASHYLFSIFEKHALQIKFFSFDT